MGIVYIWVDRRLTYHGCIADSYTGGPEHDFSVDLNATYGSIQMQERLAKHYCRYR